MDLPLLQGQVLILGLCNLAQVGPKHTGSVGVLVLTEICE